MELVTRGWDFLAASVSASDVVLLLLRLTLIGATGHLVLALLHRSAAATRHLVAIATLAMMLVTPLLGLLGSAAPTVHMTLPAGAMLDPSAPRLQELAPQTPASDESQWSESGPAESAALDESSRGPADAREHGSTRTQPTNADVTGSTSVAPASPVRIPWHRWPVVFVLLAVFGAFARVDLCLISLASIAWIGWRARRLEEPRVLARLNDAATVLGFDRAIDVRVTHRLSVPAVAVFRRPLLLLPEAALAWSDERLHAVLLHELAHVARRDEIGLAIGRLATAAFWFHPFAWSLARTARHECERACDAVVIASGVRASDYADQLLAIARVATRRTGGSMSLAFARPSSLEGRLMAILRTDAVRRPLRRRTEVLLTLVLVALLAPIAAIRVVAEPAEGRLPTEFTTPDVGSGTSEESSDISPSAMGWEDLGPVDDKSGDEWADYGHEAYQAGRYEAAGQAYERAARADFEAGDSWYRSAAAFARAGRNNQALGSLRAALDHGVAIGPKAASDRDFDGIRADRRFRLMTSVAPGTQVADLHDKNDQDEFADDAQRLKNAGMNELRNGDPDRAASFFLRQYAIDSTATSLYNAACSYAVGGREDRALTMLERSIQAGYGDEAKLRNDDDLESIRDANGFDDLVRLASDLELQFPSGKHKGDDEDRAAWERMLPRYERIAGSMPNSGRAWFNLGFADLRAKDPAAARKAFQRALDNGYRLGSSHYNVACAEAQLGNEDAALRQLVWAEESGLEVGQMAAQDDDLAALHDNPKFVSMVSRWRAAQEREKASKHKQKAWTD